MAYICFFSLPPHSSFPICPWRLSPQKKKLILQSCNPQTSVTPLVSPHLFVVLMYFPHNITSLQVSMEALQLFDTRKHKGHVKFDLPYNLEGEIVFFANFDPPYSGALDPYSYRRGQELSKTVNPMLVSHFVAVLWAFRVVSLSRFKAHSWGAGTSHSVHIDNSADGDLSSHVQHCFSTTKFTFSPCFKVAPCCKVAPFWCGTSRPFQGQLGEHLKNHVFIGIYWPNVFKTGSPMTPVGIKSSTGLFLK